MKNKKYWLGLALMGWASYSFAQTEADALRYSQLQFGGPARTQAIGGANVALGADLGSLMTNPAGLGLYQKSEVSFTPGYSVTNTSSTGTGSKTSDALNNLHVASFGAAFTNRRPDEDNSSDWRAGTFALGLNRVNNFNTSFHYAGTVADNRSLFQRFRDQRVDSTHIYAEDDNQKYETLDGLAYGALLTNIDNMGRVYTPSLLQRTGPVMQSEIVKTTGSQTQFDIGYGASYRDKLYIGGALGIMSVRYNETRDFRESDNDASNYFGSLALHDQYQTRGTGFNFRLGAIYRVTDMVRFGASVQTPTFMRLTDDSNSTLTSVFSPAAPLGGGQTTSGTTVSTQPQTYTYQLTTPFRASGGVVVTIGKYGFLSGDVEYLNYAQARFSADNTNNGNAAADPYTYDTENQSIQNAYHSAVNVRLGGEARYDIFRFRLGYARYGDPYQPNDFNRTRNYVTGGIGLRQNSFFLDLTGVYNTDNRYYSPYTLNNGSEPVITVNINRFTTSATVGFIF